MFYLEKKDISSDESSEQLVIFLSFNEVLIGPNVSSIVPHRIGSGCFSLEGTGRHIQIGTTNRSATPTRTKISHKFDDG